MERKSFSPNKKVSVKFPDDVGLSEGAVDLGGPMREFFTLALEKVLSGKLFCGQEHQKFLSYDAKALKQGEYFKAGQLFSMALAHCGIGPRCLSPILFDSMVKGPGEIVVPIDSVYDPELQLGPVHMIPLTGTSRLPRRIFLCVHMEYFVPLAEMKLHCSSIISVCKTSTFQSSNTNT